MISHPRARRDELLIQEALDELLAYDKLTFQAHCLNPTTAAIWLACDGKTSVASLATHASEKTGVFCNEDMVWAALKELGSRNLLDVVPALPAELMSRRRVITKIGIGAALITTIVVPTAVMACSGVQGPQGCVPCGGPQGPQCPF